VVASTIPAHAASDISIQALQLLRVDRSPDLAVPAVRGGVGEADGQRLGAGGCAANRAVDFRASPELGNRYWGAGGRAACTGAEIHGKLHVLDGNATDGRRQIEARQEHGLDIHLNAWCNVESERNDIP
jgi:hypothetical protein